MMSNDTLPALRDHVAALLRGGQAYEPFEAIVDEFPPPLRGIVPLGAEHSAWQILEHMRFTLRDILDFTRNDDGSYVQPEWPEDYWPREAAPQDEGDWIKARGAYLADRDTLESLVRDPKSELFTPFPWGDGQTLLREALLAADHAGYHLGQMVLLRRLLDAQA
jgi:hypothetical protein